MGDSSSLNLAEEAKEGQPGLLLRWRWLLAQSGQHTAGGSVALNSLPEFCALDGAPKKTDYAQGRLWRIREELSAELGQLRNP